MNGKEKNSKNTLISVGLFTILIIAIGVTLYIASTPPLGERFTEFYYLGPSGQADGYPTNLTLGDAGTVILVIVNHEYEETIYRIVIRLETETIATINDITLKHEEVYAENYTFTPEKTGNRMKLEFLLYKTDVVETYRQVHLWITVNPQA